MSQPNADPSAASVPSRPHTRDGLADHDFHADAATPQNSHPFSAVAGLMAMMKVIWCVYYVGVSSGWSADLRLVGVGSRIHLCIVRLWQLAVCISWAVGGECGLSSWLKSQHQAGTAWFQMRGSPNHATFTTSTCDGSERHRKTSGKRARISTATGSGAISSSGTRSYAASNSNHPDDHGDTEQDDPESSRRGKDPEVPAKDCGRFRCIWYYVKNFRWSTQQEYHVCAAKRPFVSKFRIHHQKHGFWYCASCFERFKSCEERDEHNEPCGKFKCVSRNCPNRGKFPSKTRCNHVKNKNDQESLHSELFRLAKADFGLEFDLAKLAADNIDLSIAFHDDTTELDDGLLGGPTRYRGADAVAGRGRQGHIAYPGQTQLQETLTQMRSTVAVLERMQALGTEMTDAEHVAMRMQVQIDRQLHGQLLKRWKQSTEGDDLDVLAEIARFEEAHGQGIERPQTPQPPIPALDHNTPLELELDQVQQFQADQTVLNNMGAIFPRFPGDIPHTPLSGSGMGAAHLSLSSSYQATNTDLTLSTSDQEMGEYDDEHAGW